MSKAPKIDITKAVMSQIESGQVKMRPKSHFTFKKTVKVVGLILIGLLIVASVFYSAIVIQNGVYKEYLEFGKQGASIFWSSLPWGSIAISLLLTATFALGLYLIEQKKRLVPTFVGTFAVLALVAALVFKAGPTSNDSALARAVLQTSGNPTKIACSVQEKNGNQLRVKTSDGKIITINISQDTLGDKEFEVGDELLVLGYKQNDNVNADAVKLTKKAEKKTAEAKQAEPTKVEPEVKPTEEPKPAPKPASTTPTVTPTNPTSPPPAPVEYISFDSSVTGLPVGGPYTKYYVTWTANFTSNYKLVWSTSPNPTWPTSHYSYSGVYSNSDSGKVLKDMGSGAYYVRACRYIPATSTCDLYSNQITVVFP